MKLVYNAVKKPITNYWTKEILNFRVQSFDILTQNIKTLEIKEITNKGSNRVLYQNKFGMNKVGFSYLSHRQFSSKVDENESPRPNMRVGGDFATIVKENSIFVDKSLFIKEIIDDKNEAILLAMPRRWGKSLNLDMLRRFLSLEVDKNGKIIPNKQTENYKLFAGGKIEVNVASKKIEKIIKKSQLAEKHPSFFDLHQGQYPVIFINFNSCDGADFEKVKSQLKDIMTETIEQFDYLKFLYQYFYFSNLISLFFSYFIDYLYYIIEFNLILH